MKPSLWRDLSLSAATAGFVAVLVGYTSSVAIVFEAARALGASPEGMASWLWALGVGMGLCTLLPSLWWRQPVMVAWSTPGAAVLASAAVVGGFTMAQAVAAFMASAALTVLVGATGWFERVISRIPMALASALLAGVLARFGLQAFGSASTDAALVVVMLLAYLAGRRLSPRYAVPLTLLAGVLWAAAQGRMDWQQAQWAWSWPTAVLPEWSWQAMISLAIPLFVVTMASQNLPGVAAIRTAGYGGAGGIPVSKVITLTGVATLVLAPFGAFALCLSAITAAICMGREAHEDPTRRYTAAVTCGALYLLLGLFGAAVTGVLTAFPRELVQAIAGLALLGTIGHGLASALSGEDHREAALITFLVTLSGVVLWGVSSAFWGVVAGALALFVQKWRFRSP